MSRLSIYLICLVTVFFASIAAAAPTSGCTSQTWNFSTSTDPIGIPSECPCDNPYGTPTATLSTTGSSDFFGWLAAYDGRDGVWRGEPLQIELMIPNQAVPNPYKEIYLEMDFQPTLEWIQVTPIPLAGSSVEVISPLTITPTGVGQWQKLTIGWRIEPNPEYETICLSLTGTGGFVDFITVNTCCIPEPATLALLGLGGLVLMRRSKN